MDKITERQRRNQNAWFWVMFLATLISFFLFIAIGFKHSKPTQQDKGWVKIYDDDEDSLYHFD